MAHTPTIRQGGRSARTIHPTAKLTLAAALCMLALPASSRWVQKDHLFADDAAVGDRFGTSVAIDGDTIVVGAFLDDTAAGNGAGSAYVFTRTGANWSQQDHLFADDAAAADEFGSSVAIDGDTIVVGAAYDDTAAAVRAGSAYVFTRTGANWSQQDHLFAGDAAADDLFGTSVAIDGDTIVVGAYQDNTAAGIEAGSAYVFARTGATWSQKDHLFADDAATYDRFGSSVAIDGDTIVVGAYGDDTAAGNNAGSAYVFARTGATWVQQDRLFTDDPAAGDNFGWSVAIDGDTIVVGAAADDTAAGNGAGSAYVFTPYDPFDIWPQVDHLFADDAAAQDNFGWSVAIDGDTIVVGAAADDTAAAVRAGSAYVFTCAGTTWSQQDHLFADDAAADDQFGTSAAIDGDTIVVGQYDDFSVDTDAGSAYVYVLSHLDFFIGEPELPSGH